MARIEYTTEIEQSVELNIDIVVHDESGNILEIEDVEQDGDEIIATVVAADDETEFHVILTDDNGNEYDIDSVERSESTLTMQMRVPSVENFCSGIEIDLLGENISTDATVSQHDDNMIVIDLSSAALADHISANSLVKVVNEHGEIIDDAIVDYHSEGITAVVPTQRAEIDSDALKHLNTLSKLAAVTEQAYGSDMTDSALAALHDARHWAIKMLNDHKPTEIAPPPLPKLPVDSNAYYPIHKGERVRVVGLAVESSRGVSKETWEYLLTQTGVVESHQLDKGDVQQIVNFRNATYSISRRNLRRSDTPENYKQGDNF